ncbi:MAG: diaminopimelate epimerase [Bdellovibrionota bacterium]
MNKLNGVKYSGAGNTIILTLETDTAKLSKTKLAHQLCDPNSGPGADGVLYLKKDKTGEVDYVWDFYNADGSSAEMCGNAARCAGQYCYEELKFVKKKIIFKTRSGIISCEKNEDNQFVVEMPSAKIIENEMQLSTATSAEKFMYVDVGVPHLVIEKNEAFLSKANEAQTLAWAKAFREHPRLAPAGANVTIVQSRNNKKKAVTFERGVENFTLSCGTGAVAAALYFEKKTPEGLHEIHMPGGKLIVDFSNAEKPLLKGPSEKIKEFIYEGDF